MSGSAIHILILVPGKGIEPLTRSLQGCRSATELDRLIWCKLVVTIHPLKLFRQALIHLS